jgi:hypothetical protein
MSVALRGNIARELISSFEGTDFGKFVLANSMEKPPSPLKIYHQFESRATPQVQKPMKTPEVETVHVPPSFDRVVRTFSGGQFGV